MSLIAISGSLRRESYNSKLIAAAAKLLEAQGHKLEIVDWSALPVFSEDLERPSMPEAVAAFREKVAAARGILISTPEYNAALPGALKNAIDWGSRAPLNVWGGKVVAAMGVTVGAWGAVHAVRDLRHVLGVLGATVLAPQSVNVPFAKDAFGPQGDLLNALAVKNLESLLSRWLEVVGSSGK